MKGENKEKADKFLLLLFFTSAPLRFRYMVMMFSGTHAPIRSLEHEMTSDIGISLIPVLETKVWK